MILCVCNNVPALKYRRLLEKGLTPSQAMRKLNIGNPCGKCIKHIRSSQDESSRTTR